MGTITLATWNINSVRIRLHHLARFVEMVRPDVLCLQEIKCRDGEFPSNAFAAMGLPHCAVAGQKGWHGVATVSRFPIEPAAAPELCRHGEARVQTVRVEGLALHNLYVPAGGDVANPEANPKFDHKLDFLARMRAAYAGLSGPRVLLGDLNIAPGEHDVWSHERMLDVVSHTPVETQNLEAIRATGGFVDLARALSPADAKIFTWWSYRSPDWRAANRGRRLDHIWASADLAPRCDGFEVVQEARDWEKPSDHAPVVVRLTP